MTEPLDPLPAGPPRPRLEVGRLWAGGVATAVVAALLALVGVLIVRAVLRIATYELRMRPDIPYRVVINEAIETSKKFGAEHGHTYVNGVLDKAAAAMRSTEAQASRAR